MPSFLILCVHVPRRPISVGTATDMGRSQLCKELGQVKGEELAFANLLMLCDELMAEFIVSLSDGMAWLKKR